jgi:hypothetical protein
MPCGQDPLDPATFAPAAAAEPAADVLELDEADRSGMLGVMTEDEAKWLLAFIAGYAPKVFDHAVAARSGCHASMTRAEDMAVRIMPGEEPPETSYVQAGLVETQHADALRSLGDLDAARSYAQQSVDAARHSHSRGRVHRLATLATIIAGQGDAEAAAGTAALMLDQAAGMESRRIDERIIRVRNAVTGMSDGRAAAELAERVTDMTGSRLRRA